jgi:hypothetical protein
VTEGREPREGDRDIGREIVRSAIGPPIRPKRRAHRDRAINLWLGGLFFLVGGGPVALSIGVVALDPPVARPPFTQPSYRSVFVFFSLSMESPEETLAP